MAKQERKVLFSGGKGGYGHALNVGADGYHWAYGMDCRNGRAVPVAGPSALGAKVLEAAVATGLFEWPKGNNGDPVLLMPGGSGKTGFGQTIYVHEIANGAVTEGYSSNGVPYTGGVLFKHDGTTADTEMAYFCNGTAEQPLLQRNAAGTYSATGHTAKADQLYAIGSDLWRVFDGYKLNKLTADQDPGLSGSWEATHTPVGRPSYSIHTVLEMGGSPVPVTGQGVFRYNAATGQYDNMTPFVPAHPDNGKGAFADGRGRIFFPTVTGRILVLGLGSASQQAPLRQTWIDRDTPWGRIGQMTADEEFIYAAVEPGSIRTQELGMVVKAKIGPATNTYTNQLNDQSYGTTADWSTMVNGDYIYVGADEPFWGVYFQVEAGNAGAHAAFVTHVSDGSGGWTLVTNKDSTVTLSESGCIAIVPTTDIYADGSWKTDTVDGQAGKYWLRITVGATMTALSVREAYVCPYRPPIDPDVFPETGQMLAGVLPKVLIGQWRGESIVWHDAITLKAAKVQNLIVSQVTASDTVGTTALYIGCLDDIYYLPIGPDADPIRAAWPKTNGVTHFQAFSGLDFGTTAEVKEVEIRGEFLQSDDNFYVYHRWDNGDRWYKHETEPTFPAVVRDLEGYGRVLHVAYALKDNSRDAVAPYVSWAEVPEDGWRDLGRVQTRGADIAAPQTV